MGLQWTVRIKRQEEQTRPGQLAGEGYNCGGGSRRRLPLPIMSPFFRLQTVGQLWVGAGLGGEYGTQQGYLVMHSPPFPLEHQTQAKPWEQCEQLTHTTDPPPTAATKHPNSNIYK